MWGFGNIMESLFHAKKALILKLKERERSETEKERKRERDVEHTIHKIHFLIET